MRIPLSELSRGLNVDNSYVEFVGKLNESPDDISTLLKNKYANYIENDYNKLAGRLYIYFKIYFCPRTVEEYVEIAQDYLDERGVDFLKKNSIYLNKVLEEDEFENYKHYDYFSAHTVVSYLLRTKGCRSICETPILLMLRQAIDLYSTNPYFAKNIDGKPILSEEDRVDALVYYEDLSQEEELSRVMKCYNELKERRYVHASPVMFNSLTKKAQKSSCFLAEAGDSLESIKKLDMRIAFITKNNGATGLNMSNLRHSDISNSGESDGSIPWGRGWDMTLTSVNQGGKRNGAGTFFMRMCHLDIEEHIDMLNYTSDIDKKYKTAKVCILTNGLFFERMKKSNPKLLDWTLFCPAKAKMNTNIYFNKKLDNKESIVFNGKTFYNAYYGNEYRTVKLFDCYDYEFDFWYPIFECQIEQQSKDIEILENKKREIEKKGFMKSIDLEKEYRKIMKELNEKKDSFFINKKINTLEFMGKIQNSQIKSGYPFMVNEDSINYINNTKRTDKNIVCSNLCLEITLPCDINNVASCNLGNVNLKDCVRGKLDRSVKFSHLELKRIYDFARLGESVRSLVRNINKVIDNNYYLGIEFKRPNLENRPIGLGVSGFGNCLYQMDIYPDSEEAILFNKMVFACMYYHALHESMLLAYKEGEYYNFREGIFMKYDTSRKEFIELQGSPASNGYLQFDLWRDHYAYKYDIGRLKEDEYKKCWDEDRDVIPTSWFLDDKDRYTVKETLFNYNMDWDKLKFSIKTYGIRNSMLIALMPTATSAQLLNNTEITELHTSNLYNRKTNNGTFLILNEEMVEDFKDKGVWNKNLFEFIKMNDGSLSNLEEYFKENYPTQNMKDFIIHMKRKYPNMHETKMKLMCDMTRDRALYVCHSESHNIFAGNCEKEKLIKYHIYAEMLSLKTPMYYLHQLDTVKRTSLTIQNKSSSEEEVKACRRENKDCLSCQ
jgi:ribonucleotide reductase alpha subunit